MDNNCVFSTDDVMVRVMARMDELRVAGGVRTDGTGAQYVRPPTSDMYGIPPCDF